MAIMAANNGGDFKQAETGSCIGRCYQIIDLGHQEQEYEGQKSIKHQVLISWELPTQDRLEDGQPMSIGKFYTLSLHPKSNLGADLVSWRGKSFTPEEEAGFDISKLIGVPAFLSIVDKNGKSRVGSVMAVPKNMDVPEAINAPVIFDMENYVKGDSSVFDGLSEGLQGIILKAKELTAPSREPGSDDELDPDVPF